ncbi:MAG TPA: selenide, water dikinase SelD [Verrucomicrobiae bacterium]|nr:selenide, water dikinase SelD [Verrucomicrobiae bacterium]
MNKLKMKNTNGRMSGLRLTSLSSCAGCAAKLGQQALSQVLRLLPALPRDPNLLVGTDTADDAAVYLLNHRLALVQTVDFFTPIVDDPFAYGQIAATNAISDVYAMGGRPLTALNLVGMPTDLVPAHAIAEILRGGLMKAQEAGCTVVGGHTIRLPEPVYGMAVTGLVAPRAVIVNNQARPGDWLILTKPLGTGVVTTAIKRGMASLSLQRKAIRSMATLNSVGAELAESRLVAAGTDVTGFGLLGHLANICRGSGVGAEIQADALPVFAPEVFRLIEQDCIPGGSRKNLETADQFTEWGEATTVHRHLLTDAQTSGGLLLCVSPKRLEAALAALRSARTLCAAVIGRIVRASRSRVFVTISVRQGKQSRWKTVVNETPSRRDGKSFVSRRNSGVRYDAVSKL